MPETSVLIRAFNEERHLPELFAALDLQDYRDFEVVVVDSGSFDGSLEIARNHADQVVQIEPRDFTFGYSLNVGMLAARGAFVAIISAHAIPVDASWLGHLVAALRTPNVAMVYGRQLGRSESKFSEARDLAHTYDAGPPRLLPPDRVFANNANSAVPRHLWLECPFDEALTGLEDIQWARFWAERGWHVAYEPRAAVFHIHLETWPQVRRRYYREALAAKALRLQGRHHLPWALGHAIGYAVTDFWAATRLGRLRRCAREIAGFRWNQCLGQIRGLCGGTDVMESPRRQAILYERRYRAAIIEAPGRIVLQESNLPAPKPGEVVVRVAFQGICATDLEILNGELGYYKSGVANYPIVPGHEFSGTVAEVGGRVQDWTVGDRVVVECIQSCGACANCARGNAIGCEKRTEVGVIGRNGGYAEYMITPARFLHHVPPDLPLQVACLAEPLAVVLKGLRRLARVWQGGRAAVVGAGPIGHLAARVLAHRGCQVTLFDRNPQRLAAFADGPIATASTLDSLPGFDAAIEATGDPVALDRLLQLSAPGSAILLLGLPYSKRDFSFESVVCQDKTIVGSVGSGPEDFEQALQVLPRLDTSAFFQRMFSLQDLEAALACARSRELLKVVLCPHGTAAITAAATAAPV